MPAVHAASTPATNPLLAAVDGGTFWTGEIAYNRVNTPAEAATFQAELPAPYTTTGAGLTDGMWNMLTADLAVLRSYAAISYTLSDGADANYFVSDFQRPDSPNTTGIAAQPGNGPIVALNRVGWLNFGPQIQDWVILHELQHTLGFRHVSGLPEALDRAQYTVMSYNWFQLAEELFQEGLPLTPMALDVALLQAKYGAAETNTGATTYALTSFGIDRDGADGRVTNGSGYICVWDSAGADTLRYDGGQACLINLNAATLDTGPLSGDLAVVIGALSATSRVFAGLSAAAQAEIVDPVRTAGGFFSSLIAGGFRDPAGYTIARGAVIEAASGGSGDDLLVGNAAANLLEGGAGRDDLYGGAGDDTLDGGAGDDVAYGGAGDDVLVGNLGVSLLRGNEGNDSLRGGDLFDDLHGNVGNDTVSGGGFDDWVVGGQGNDMLFGGSGGDLCYGQLGEDTVDGGDGADAVIGGQANDMLFGGAGDDFFITGDRGDDTVSGGTGADVFHTNAVQGLDRITDFSLAEGDRVQIDPGNTYVLRQVGADTVIDFGGGNTCVLVGVQMSTLTGGWIFGG